MSASGSTASGSTAPGPNAPPPNAPRRVLVLGGTGVFGRRLARHLATHGMGGSPVDLVVSSRDRARAEALAGTLRAETGAAVAGQAVDTRHGFADTLDRIGPWAVVDCSGPFQGAGHGTARAILGAGAHAIDLADARDYLHAYPASLDAVARAQGVVGLAGASSTPTLSGAVVTELTRGWREVGAIDIAIVPGGRSEVGRSVLDAVLSYAGRPVPLWQDGRVASARGWGGGHAIEVEGLGRRRVARVETVDAERLGARHDVRGHVAFWAGLESTPEQRGLELLSWLVGRGVPLPLPRLAAPLHRARALTRLTTGDRGGMVVRASGIDADGRRTNAEWTLLAVDGSGPQVPVLAAAAALGSIARGRVPPGARLADEACALDTIMAEAAPYPITARIERDRRPASGKAGERPARHAA